MRRNHRRESQNEDVKEVFSYVYYNDNFSFHNKNPYTTTSCFSIPSTQNVFLKSSTRAGDPIALFGLSESFTHDTHSFLSGRQTASGLTTIDIEPNGQNFSRSLGRVHLVLFESSVPQPFVRVPRVPWNLSVTFCMIS